MRFGKLGQLSQKLVHNGSVGQTNNDASSDAMNVEKDKNSTTDSNGGKNIYYIYRFFVWGVAPKKWTSSEIF